MAKKTTKSAKSGPRAALKKTPKSSRARSSTRAASASSKSATRTASGSIDKNILAYNASQAPGDERICDTLCEAIHQNLPGAENKIWHRHPVWFLDGNPIVGYHKLKDCIRLLFWSGRSFDEPGLPAEAGFQTAGARYTTADQIPAKDLKRWLKKSIDIQWDYKNIVKRKGRLERLK